MMRSPGFAVQLVAAVITAQVAMAGGGIVVEDDVVDIEHDAALNARPKWGINQCYMVKVAQPKSGHKAREAARLARWS
jgi:hypothetical protein